MLAPVGHFTLAKTVRRLVFCVMLLSGVAGRGAVILQYHHVDDDTPASTSVSPAQFAEHLRAIEREGFRVVRLDTLVDEARSGLDPREKVLAITFDDGYDDLAEHALPMLEQRGWPAAIFVTTGQIGGAGMLSADQLKAIHGRGHLLLNHAARHDHLVRRLPGESAGAWHDRVRNNISEAQRALQALTGSEPLKYFAWPYGEHDDTLRALLAEMNYVAFGQQSGAVDAVTDWQQVPRVAVNRHFAGWPALRDKLLALPMPVTGVTPASGVTTDMSPQLQFYLPLSWQSRGLNCFANGGAVEETRVVDKDRVRVRLRAPVTVGRSRFTCTAAAGDGRFYWFSWMWMRRTKEGWYSE